MLCGDQALEITTPGAARAQLVFTNRVGAERRRVEQFDNGVASCGGSSSRTFELGYCTQRRAGPQLEQLVAHERQGQEIVPLQLRPLAFRTFPSLHALQRVKLTVNAGDEVL